MLDHLVYLVADLPEAMRRLRALGLPLSPGGRHLRRGTHNALLRLGTRTYLELLAPDPRSEVAPPRWMGIDVGELPRMSRWAVDAGANIPGKAALLGAEVQAGQRLLSSGQLLKWQLTDPGTELATSVLPFLIEWGESGVHPCDILPDEEVRLLELRLFHPTPESINPIMAKLGTNQKAAHGNAPRIEAVFRGRLGTVVL